MLNKKSFKENISKILLVDKNATLNTASIEDLYYAISKASLLTISNTWLSQNHDKKEASYFSAEFLMGRAFSNNLINFGIYNEVKEVLQELKIDINLIENQERDAGLGNGGLGRLAACFLDSAATLNIPLNGYGIRYEYGLFKQHFENGFQIEKADDWLQNSDPWSIRKNSDSVIVSFKDFSVKAIPYDMPIIGYNSNTINTLRLWKSEALNSFNFTAFNNHDYYLALKEKNRAENISRVLYPNDSCDEGKLLRIRQQYFFTSASLQDLIKKHKKRHGTLDTFHEFNTIQLNDTHPAISIPELIRLFIDEEGYEFNSALDIAKKTFSYTNHTILSEALEQWSIKYFEAILPRIYELIQLIDLELLNDSKISNKNIDDYRIISNDKIKMAWLSIYGSKCVNGVAKLHTGILMNSTLKQWYDIYPEKFQNNDNI